MEINTTLLREKFVILDTEKGEDGTIIASGNRLVLPLFNSLDSTHDTLVIRTKTMHECVRMTSLILQDFIRNGPLFSRNAPFDFAALWDKSQSEYDKTYGQDQWLAIYYKGAEIFASGKHHAFLDVIEKCDVKNQGNYDKSVKIAEEAFKQMGRKVSISYESNIGMVLNVKPDIGRCGLIYRGARKSSTFNFTASTSEIKTISPVHCLTLCANLLEGLQLAYAIGPLSDRLTLSLIGKYSEEAQQLKKGGLHLRELERGIGTFENLYKIMYRPEKPDFSLAMTDSEKAHRKSYLAEKELQDQKTEQGIEQVPEQEIEEKPEE